MRSYLSTVVVVLAILGLGIFTVTAAAGSGSPAPSVRGAPETAPAMFSLAGCTTNCGTPRFFCDTGNWALCDDYRDVYCPVHCAFPNGSGQDQRSISVNRLSSTYPDGLANGYSDAAAANGSFGNDQEHFHTNVEDGQFGIVIMRHWQPIDLSAERHIHFEVDLKVSSRRYVRFTLSPDLSKTHTDDRQMIHRLPNALDIWDRNGVLQGFVLQNGVEVDHFPACIGCPGQTRYGQENVRDLIDLYVSRTHLKILINGVTYIDRAQVDLGFSQAYLYLTQASYNPCKGWTSEGFNQYGDEFECNEPAQVFHWDNVAFDGPVLVENALTPYGKRDVLFNVRGADSCTVKGLPAQPVAPTQWGTWTTWRARINDDGTSATIASVACVWAQNNGSSAGDIQAFEVVHQQDDPNTDTDGDGTNDRDDGDDDNDTVADGADNCRLVANPSLANADADFIDLSPPRTFDDKSRPFSDNLGDACDADDDNDSLSDAQEANGSACAGVATNPRDSDTDGDNFLDGAECARNANPALISSRPTLASCGATDDPDGDKVPGHREVCFFNTDPANPNTDGDFCNDGREVASVNGTGTVDVLDLLVIAGMFGGYVMPGSDVHVDFDLTRNGSIDVLDMQQAAALMGSCP